MNEIERCSYISLNGRLQRSPSRWMMRVTVVSRIGRNKGVIDLQGYLSQVDLNALEGLQRKGKS